VGAAMSVCNLTSYIEANSSRNITSRETIIVQKGASEGRERWMDLLGSQAGWILGG
jgi:hypothetical protein